MTLKQRVPMGKTADGTEVFITLEWLKDLGATFATTASATSTNTTALPAQISALQSSIAALTARVKKLEGGYQV